MIITDQMKSLGLEWMKLAERAYRLNTPDSSSEEYENIIDELELVDNQLTSLIGTGHSDIFQRIIDLNKYAFYAWCDETFPSKRTSVLQTIPG